MVIENTPIQAVNIIDDGTKEIPLVNKFGQNICTIHIRPSDFSIIDRYNEVARTFDDIVKPIETLSIKNNGTVEFGAEWETLKSVENALKEKLNYLFDMDEADAIFAKRNPFSIIGGKFFCERVFEVLGAVIAQAIEDETELSRKRMSKYLDGTEANDDRSASDEA